uniref:SAC3 domain-containing protein 1 n=1 Tax=Culex pipiens TaxID=7175 RepID=A0A8D8FTS1_CULPI
MESFIRGSCESMCPKPEIELRTREKLVHFYELKPTASGHSRSSPDPERMVKEFARSAAGMRQPRHWELRTVRTLKRTVRFLLTEIIQDERRPYSFRYEFIFDRLRAIRQELVMQNLGPEETLDILEPSVRFLAYSAYRLCECHISEFDPKICTTHVQECLKKILRCYDDLDVLAKRYERSRRVAMEGLYLMFNLGSTEAVLRGVNLPKEYRENLSLQLSTSIEYLRGNFYRVLRNVERLSALEAAVATLKLPEIRRQLLLHFSAAYASKVLTVPLEWVGHVLHYPERDHPALLEDCQYYNLQLIGGDDRPKNQSTVKTSSTKDNWWDEEDSFEERGGDILGGMTVKFERTRFDSSKPTKQPRRTECADRKLGQVASLAEVLL